MRRRRYEFHPQPPSARQRIAAGILLAVFIAIQANYYADWGFFGGYDKPVSAASVIMALIVMARFMPGVRRVEHRS